MSNKRISPDRSKSNDKQTFYNSSAELEKLGYFAGYLFLGGSIIFLYFWLFGVSPKTLFTKTIPIDSLSKTKSYAVDSITLPADLRACEVEIQLNDVYVTDVFLGTVSKYTAVATVEFADDADKPAGEMEAEFYHDFGAGWSETKKKEKKYFSVPKSGKFNIDIFLDRQAGLNEIKPSVFYKDSMVNNVMQKIARVKNDTLPLPQPKATFFLKITTPENLFAENSFWGFIIMAIIGGSMLVTVHKAWAETLGFSFFMLIFVGFIALTIWLDS
ncbi:MAG: hypothetical protein EAZ85_12000 [Bacteroidetes bacterium]|nr:MAG: hypothetical protein EAZ85_12000 [Bacteroidota bacterium]TAG94113.1 MAG: hypothetical protein EAZ20_01160 [Bacteroidota bacterium]